MSQPTHEALLKMRQENIGRLFQRAARGYSERALVKLEARGHQGLTLFHTALISNLDIEGTQISTLAERAGVSKQAMGKIAAELEARCYVERVPDPADKRAALLKFTDLGYRFLQDAYHVKVELEADYAQVIGKEGIETLSRLLTALIETTGNAGEGDE